MSRESASAWPPTLAIVLSWMFTGTLSAGLLWDDIANPVGWIFGSATLCFLGLGTLKVIKGR